MKMTPVMPLDSMNLRISVRLFGSAQESWGFAVGLKGTVLITNFHVAVELSNADLNHCFCPAAMLSPSSIDFAGPSSVPSGSRWLRVSSMMTSTFAAENRCQIPACGLASAGVA